MRVGHARAPSIRSSSITASAKLSGVMLPPNGRASSRSRDQRRLDRARKQRIHPNAVFRRLLGEGPGEGRDSEFRGGVARGERRAPQPVRRRRGADVQDVAFAARHHHWQKRAVGQKRPMQIDVDRALPCGERQIAGRRRQSLIPGRHHRNDEKIHRPVMGSASAASRCMSSGTETSDAYMPVLPAGTAFAELRKSRGKAIAVARDGDDAAAALRQSPAEGAADAAAAADDDADMAGSHQASACRAARAASRRARAGRRPAGSWPATGRESC